MLRFEEYGVTINRGSAMFPKPKCPICGRTFETTTEAISHLDEQRCDHLEQNTIDVSPESAEHLKTQEAKDPSTDTVEEAG